MYGITGRRVRGEQTGHLWFLGAAVVLAAGSVAQAQTAVATYVFGENLNSLESGPPALIATDPLSQNGFVRASVFGRCMTVFRTDGNADPVIEQAGLTLETDGLIPPDWYTVELVFKFLERDNAWRKILDTHDRQSDQGFYVHPSNVLEIYDYSPKGTTAWDNDEYHHVVLVVSTVYDPQQSTTTTKAFLDGNLEFTTTTNGTDTTRLDNEDNLDKLLHVFLDNFVVAPNECSDAEIALMRVYDYALTDEEVEGLDPFAGLCPADFNKDGFVDPLDYNNFINAFEASRPSADYNCDGFVDPLDYNQFINDFENGC